MKLFRIISYNIHCNFTNYGSALQTWALHQAIKRLGKREDGLPEWEPILVDYCPDCLLDQDPLDPMRNMWDEDVEARRLCELSLPAIKVNAVKFDKFYAERMQKSADVYTSANFDTLVMAEKIDGFVCGSDTIFCPDEFGGFEDGYYANYASMRQKSIAYAASFGDPHFAEQDYPVLNNRLSNFLALGLRENLMVPYVQEHTVVPVARVLDPTLLLEAKDYEPIIAGSQEEGDYLLLYSRRYNPAMERYAEELAEMMGWKVVEISLRAENASKHRIFYEAGVEEFLALVRDARFVVTISFHGLIFSYQFETPFYVFSREQCDTKISGLLDLMGLSDRLLIEAPVADEEPPSIEWASAKERMAAEREFSLEFLGMELNTLNMMAGE